MISGCGCRRQLPGQRAVVIGHRGVVIQSEFNTRNLSLNSRHCHALDAQRRNIETSHKFEIIGGSQVAVHILQVPGNGHFINRKSHRSVLDPKSRRRLAVIASHAD